MFKILTVFPNNSTSLGGIRPQVVVSKQSGHSREAVIRKEAACIQPLVPQGLEVLLVELHCTVIGANALISLQKTSQFTCV